MGVKDVTGAQAFRLSQTSTTIYFILKNDSIRKMMLFYSSKFQPKITYHLCEHNTVFQTLLHAVYITQYSSESDGCKSRQGQPIIH